MIRRWNIVKTTKDTIRLVTGRTTCTADASNPYFCEADITILQVSPLPKAGDTSATWGLPVVFLFVSCDAFAVNTLVKVHSTQSLALWHHAHLHRVSILPFLCPNRVRVLKPKPMIVSFCVFFFLAFAVSEVNEGLVQSLVQSLVQLLVTAWGGGGAGPWRTFR